MSYILKREDIHAFARYVNADVRQKGDELFFRYCPRCKGGNGHDRDTFSVNLNSGAFKCFRAGCGYQGHFVELARDFGFALDMGEAKTFRKFRPRPIEVRGGAVEYLAGRGIDRKTVEKYRVTTRKDNRGVVAFPFFDEQNELQFVKYRAIKPKPGQPKEWCERDAKPILFGMAQCEDFGTLVITEGQIDSLSVAACGVKNAVSVPNGANGFSWLPHCWDWIAKFRDVVVFGDCERGGMTLIDTLVARLPQTVRGVRMQDYLGEKDANDILRKYGKQAILTAVERAEPPRLSNVKDLSTVEAVDVNRLPKVTTGIREIDRRIGGLVMGQVVLLTGKRGEGKSTFMSQLVCEALEQGEHVLVYSGELADYHFKRWLDYQLAGAAHIVETENAYGDPEYTLAPETVQRISDWYKGRAYIYDNNFVPADKTEFESITTTIEKAIRQYNVKLVCVDNLMTAMDVVDKQENLYLAQSTFVGRLKKIAVKYDVVIVLVAHPRKSKESFTNDDVSGSADITNKVDVVMSYARRTDGENGGELLITKNRLTGRLAMGDDRIKLLYSPKTKRIFSDSSMQRVYGWERTPLPWEDESMEDVF